MNIQIVLSELDSAVFGLVALNPTEWAQNAVKARIAAKKADLAEAEAARRLRVGLPAITDFNTLVAAALNMATPVTDPALPGPDRTAKADIWRRASDEEAATIAAGIDALPVRKRRLYADAAYLDHADPFFSELKAAFEEAFGVSRASELLAVSA